MPDRSMRPSMLPTNAANKTATVVAPAITVTESLLHRKTLVRSTWSARRRRHKGERQTTTKWWLVVGGWWLVKKRRLVPKLCLGTHCREALLRAPPTPALAASTE